MFSSCSGRGLLDPMRMLIHKKVVYLLEREIEGSYIADGLSEFL